MDRDSSKDAKQAATAKQRKSYEKPLLVVHGTVAELTQTGGVRRRDGINTRAPS